MALNFPSSPTDGQAYGNFIYSLSKGAWQAKPLTPGVATPSTVPPSSPKNGDEWFNTNDGSLYIYYNDGDTSQWVQVKSDATLSSTIGTRLETIEAKPTGLVSLVPTSATVSTGTGSYNNTTGLVTFSGSGKVTLNGVFTSLYRNYKLDVNISSSSGTNNSMAFRFTLAGSERTAANYVLNGVQMAQGSNSSYYTTQSYGDIGYMYNSPGSYSNFSLEIKDPFPAIRSKIEGMMFGLNSSGSATDWHTAILHNEDTSSDGISFFCLSGAGLTGTAQVYGYR